MNGTPRFRLPEPLHPGETIALIAPAGPLTDQARLERGLAILKEAGFRIRRQPDSRRPQGYLADTDRQRVEELHRQWRDPEVRALMAVRGGYGCMRLLPCLDQDLFRQHPKLLVGFSDLTVLHTVVNRQAGLVSLHGPMAATLGACDQPSVTSLLQALTGNWPAAIAPPQLTVLVGGNASGRLIGGNLTCLVHLLATPYEPDWQGAVLLLEEVGESSYRIDRLLTQLALSGRLEGLAGVILGEFRDCGPKEHAWQRLLEVTRDRIPVWADFPVGHGPSNHTMPLGLPVTMDAGAGVLLLHR